MDVVAKLVVELFRSQVRSVVCQYFMALAHEPRFGGFASIVVAIAKMTRPDIIAVVSQQRPCHACAPCLKLGKAPRAG